MALTADCVEILRQVASVIKTKRAQFNMEYWHQRGNENVEALCDIPVGKRISCDTTHCIAGWVQLLHTNASISSSTYRAAQGALDITEQEANRLFYADYWPVGFGGWKATAEQAADRIEHFIATDGRE